PSSPTDFTCPRGATDRRRRGLDRGSAERCNFQGDRDSLASTFPLARSCLMPSVVKCPCGKQYELGERHRSEQIQCGSCGRTLAGPGGFEPEEDEEGPLRFEERPAEELDDLEEVEERGLGRQRAGGPLVRPFCYLCDTEGKGKT